MRIRYIVCCLIAVASISCSSAPGEIYEGEIDASTRWENELKSYMEEPDAQPSSDINRESSTPSDPDLSGDPLRVPELLEAARARNPELKSARQKWKAARQNAIVQSRLPDPSVLLLVAGEAIQTRNGPVDWKVNLTQKFPWFGTLASREKAALAEAGKAAASFRKTQLEVKTRVARAFFDYYYYDRAIETTEEMRNLVGRLEENVRTRYESGETPRQDLLKTEIEQEDLERRISDLRVLREESIVRINGLLDRSDSAPLGRPDPRSRSGELPEKSKLVQQARKHRPVLNEVQFTMLRHREKIRQAHLEYYPDFTAGFRYYGIDRTDLPGAVDPGQDALDFIVGMNIPLWQRPRDARVRKNEHRRRSAALKLRDLENRTEVQITRRLATVRNERRELRYLKETAIPKARSSLENSETAYENGEVDILNLLDSEKSLLHFQLDRYRARVDYRMAMVELEKLIGTSTSLK